MSRVADLGVKLLLLVRVSVGKAMQNTVELYQHEDDHPLKLTHRGSDGIFPFMFWSALIHLLKCQLSLENLLIRGKEQPATGGSFIGSNVDLGVALEISVVDFCTVTGAHLPDRDQGSSKYPYV